ncbi:MAG: histidine kinase dimerization/phospho-acceptor domain-containing protein [Candidatus Lernaella stagnicola]|nr:histidine kinase dimerization/phospho-acceptor domain-containing protein [Candidatus Lernaella stagnicola]
MHTLLEKQLAQLRIAAQTPPDAEQWAALLNEISRAYEALLGENPQPPAEGSAEHLRHELKTPLASVRGFADVILNDTDLDDATRREFLQLIVKETDRVITLVDRHIR